MLRAPWFAGLLCTALAACASSGPEGEVGESEGALAVSAFRYTCETRQPTVLGQTTVEVTFSNEHLRFVGEWGPNVGDRDATYRAPRGVQRARFSGFGWGDDCTLKLVADQGALRGEANPKLRVQCASDDEFRQDVYDCKAPRRTRLSLPEPPPAPAPEPQHAPGASRWKCHTNDGPILESDVTVKLDDGLVSIVAGDLDYAGTRDRRYRSRSGSFAAFEDFSYGGDCTLTALLETTMLGTAREGTMKVRCKGDGYEQDVYQCTKQ